MQDKSRPPHASKAASKDEKSARLAEALRANLARRKAQKRARSEAVVRDEEQGN